jgi:type II secretion system protein C
MHVSEGAQPSVRRSVLAIIGTLITVAAIVAAMGANRFIERYTALPEGAAVADVDTEGTATPEREAVASRPKKTKTKNEYIIPILDRNIFDASAIGQTTTTTGIDSDEVRTDLNVTLIGTIVALPEEFSSALIADSAKNAKPKGYGLNDKLMDAEIIKIEPDRVTLRRANGDIEVLVMSGETERPVRTASRPGTGDDDEGIEKVSETSFVVDRDVVDRYLGDLDSLARMGRAIPHRGPDGEIDGYRLSGIRRRTVGEKLGIKNGDIVHAVNGHPLTSMQGAMSAYTSLQSEASFNFEVTRRGQKMTLEYEIR